MNQKFRLTKKQERAIIIALLGVLVAYGFYQVAYGMIIGPSGTMNVPGMPNGTWATITAPPGTKVGNITITNGSISARFTVPSPGSTVNNSLAIDPKDKDTLYGNGNNLFSLGNYTGAILYYDKALAIDPKDVHALTNKGVSLYQLGNYTGAIEYLDRALAKNPKHENALYNKGLVLHTLGKILER